MRCANLKAKHDPDLNLVVRLRFTFRKNAKVYFFSARNSTPIIVGLFLYGLVEQKPHETMLKFIRHNLSKLKKVVKDT